MSLPKIEIEEDRGFGTKVLIDGEEAVDGLTGYRFERDIRENGILHLDYVITNFAYKGKAEVDCSFDLDNLSTEAQRQLYETLQDEFEERDEDKELDNCQ